MISGDKSSSTTAVIRAMTGADFDAVIELMRNTPDTPVRGPDSRETTSHYLASNPGFSFVALERGKMVGFVMAGHDGRNGYLRHLVVLPASRGKGLAASLVERCLDQLAKRHQTTAARPHPRDQQPC